MRKNPYLDPKLGQDVDATFAAFRALVQKDLPRLDREAKKNLRKVRGFEPEAGQKNVLKDRKPQEYLGEPFLFIEAHEGDDGQRPLPARPPRCAGMRLLKNGAAVELLQAATEYEISVQVKNGGDLEAQSVYVEFFVGGSELHPASQPFRLTVQDVFSVAGRGTVVTGRVASGVVAPGMRLILRGSGGDIFATAVEFQGSSSPAGAGETVGILLRGVRKADVERGDLVLREDQLDAQAALPRVPVVDYQETLATNLAPFSEEEVRFSWTTPSSLSEVLPGMLYARVYSMAPVQLPADFDALDCARSRLVAQLALG